MNNDLVRFIAARTGLPLHVIRAVLEAEQSYPMRAASRYAEKVFDSYVYHPED